MSGEGRSHIVVGVDGEETGQRALEWALEEAGIRGCAVEAVHAWTYEPEGEFVHLTRDDLAAASTALLDRELKAALATVENPPTISKLSVEGSATHVLCEAGERAAMLVVGQHRGGFLRRAVLGSVSSTCTRHATCPVVVIPAVASKPAPQLEARAPRPSTTAVQ